MVDTISNTINNVYYLGINMGSRNCILRGMLVVMGLLLLALVIVIIVVIVKWIKNGGIIRFVDMIKNDSKYIIFAIFQVIVTMFLIAISAVLIVGIVMFILSSLGKLAGMC